jgi:hypothetical protein
VPSYRVWIQLPLLAFSSVTEPPAGVMPLLAIQIRRWWSGREHDQGPVIEAPRRG